MGLRRIKNLVDHEHNDGAMSAAQLRAQIEYLGMSRQAFAQSLKVTESSVYRWWMGLLPVSDAAVAHLQTALGHSTDLEQHILQELQAHGHARVPYDQEDLDTLTSPGAKCARYGPVFYRVAAARALHTYDEGAVKPGRLVWLNPSRVVPKRRPGRKNQS